MPKSTTTSKKAAPVQEEFDMNSMYKTVQDMTTKVKSKCLKNIPEELSEDNDKINSMYESVRDGYVELARARELFGTTLSEFSNVMRRLAEVRAKTNACAEVEPEPAQNENILNEDTQDENAEEEKHADEKEEIPKKKDKSSKKDKKKVESEDEHSEAEPEPEEPKKKDKKKK